MSVREWKSNDSGFLEWNDRNLDGFSVNLSNKKKGQFKIHRSNCKFIVNGGMLGSLNSINPFTGNEYWKVTADFLAEILEYGSQYRSSVEIDDFCAHCFPRKRGAADVFSIIGDIQNAQYLTKPALLDENSRYLANPAFLFKRRKLIRAWARARSCGKCELCEKDAPFNNIEGYPYLEVHHILPLRDGGLDNYNNVGAVCPNCHRELHYSGSKQICAQKLKENVARKDEENGDGRMKPLQRLAYSAK